jgi:NAD(P)-dependent dehydrogenase (short-subunit alcohol dehydrogenase family)
VRLEAGQVAVVTGGASGIGFGLAEAFAGRGLSVVLADVERAALDDAVRRLAERGTGVLGVVTDVSNPGQVDDLARATLDRFGRVDVICNNAGVALGSLRPTWEIDRDGWEWVLGVNLWGVINGLRTFVPLLVEQRHGHVVNTASLAGIATVPYLGPYTAAKHAVVGLSESLHAELADRAPGVGVTVVAPGAVRTRLRDAARNRPEGSAGPRGEPEPAMSTPLPDHAMEPSAVATQTLIAIEAGRLHVAPGAGSTKLARIRVDRLLADLTA